MADQNEEAMNNLATGVAADHKAARQKRADAPPEVEHVGPTKPQEAEVGDAWQNSEDGKVRYLHPNGRWYVDPPKEEKQEPDPDPDPSTDTVLDATPEAETATETADGATQEGPECDPDPDPEPEPEPEPAEEEAEDQIDDQDSGPAFNPADYDLQINPAQLVPDVRDMILERHKQMPKPWHLMNENQQRDWIARIQQDAEQLVTQVFEFAAAGGTNAIRCKLDGYSEKKGGLVATISIEEFKEDESAAAVLFLHRQRGKHVMLRAAGIDDYRGDREHAAEPDQPEIDFDPDIPEDQIYDGDDEDLAGESGEADDFEASPEELAQQKNRPSTEAAQAEADRASEDGELIDESLYDPDTGEERPWEEDQD